PKAALGDRGIQLLRLGHPGQVVDASFDLPEAVAHRGGVGRIVTDHRTVAVLRPAARRAGDGGTIRVGRKARPPFQCLGELAGSVPGDDNAWPGVVSLRSFRSPNGIRTRVATLPEERQGGVRCSSPNGIRTRVATLRGWCPRPLDDGTLV